MIKIKKWISLKCNDGYFESDSRCLACHGSWMTWTTYSECTKCNPNFSYNGIIICVVMKTSYLTI